MHFAFQVLSGQHLHGDEDFQLPIRVDVETVGVPEDCAILSTEVSKLAFTKSNIFSHGIHLNLHSNSTLECYS